MTLLCHHSFEVFFVGVYMGLHGGGKPETNLREEATLQDALALICPSLQLEVLVLENQLSVIEKS